VPFPPQTQIQPQYPTQNFTEIIEPTKIMDLPNNISYTSLDLSKFSNGPGNISNIAQNNTCTIVNTIKMIGNLLCSSKFEYYRARAVTGRIIGSLCISFMVSRKASSIAPGIITGMFSGIICAHLIGNLPTISSLMWRNFGLISLFLIPLVGSIMGCGGSRV